MRELLINAALYCVLGATVATAGLYFEDWQFWVIIAVVIIVRQNAVGWRFDGRRKIHPAPKTDNVSRAQARRAVQKVLHEKRNSKREKVNRGSALSQP